MKNKKFILGFIIGCLIMSMISTPVGASVKEYLLTKASYKVMVGDREYTDEELPILNWEGKTYVPLAKLGDILNVHVGWNEELRQVEIGDMYKEEETVEEVDENSNDELIEATLGEFYKYLALDFGVYDENAEFEFDNITKDNEYYSYIASLNNNDLINLPKSYPKSELYKKLANKNVAFMIYNLLYLPPIKEFNINDVSFETHFYGSIYKVVYYELMKLDQNGNFNPDDYYIIDYSISLYDKIQNINKKYNNPNNLEYLEFSKEYTLDNGLSIQLNSFKFDKITNKNYRTYEIDGIFKNTTDKKIHPGFLNFVFENGVHIYCPVKELNSHAKSHFIDNNEYYLYNRGNLLYIEYEPYYNYYFSPYEKRIIWKIN